MKEGKTPAAEPQRPSADILTKQLPAGLLGLEIPPDVRDVLKVGERLTFISATMKPLCQTTLNLSPLGNDCICPHPSHC